MIEIGTVLCDFIYYILQIITPPIPPGTPNSKFLLVNMLEQIESAVVAKHSDVEGRGK